MKRDWRDEKNYEYTKKHTRDLWAWEFLRRNPEYQAEWEEALDSYRKNNTSNDRFSWVSEILRQIYLKYWKDTFANYRAINEKNDRGIGMWNLERLIPEYKEEWKKALKSSRTNKKRNDHIPDMISLEGVRERWGLMFDEIINPDIDAPSYHQDCPLFYCYGAIYSENDLKINLLPKLDNGKVAVVYDLTQPIRPQNKIIIKLLEERQADLEACGVDINKQYRTFSAKWETYIRVLDGMASGATNRKLAEILFPEKKNDDACYEGTRKVIDTAKQAKLLLNKGYIALMFRDDMINKPPEEEILE